MVIQIQINDPAQAISGDSVNSIICFV